MFVWFLNMLTHGVICSFQFCKEAIAFKQGAWVLVSFVNTVFGKCLGACYMHMYLNVYCACILILVCLSVVITHIGLFLHAV